jgi:acyl-CoA synthetase (AMP-forming)/AMP-acid ligase II
MGWLSSPRSDHALHFADDEGGWRDSSYDELAALVRGAAAQIAEHGGAPGSTVVIVLPTGADFVAAFYGALLAGATPCPIAPPGYFSQSRSYRDHLTRVLDGARPSVVLTDDFLLPEIEAAVEAADVRVAATVARFDTDAAPPPPAPLPDVALLQYTSGSTGDPRGVVVTRDNLDAHLALASEWVSYTPDQVSAFWIPLYHDMGLIGALLTGVAHQQTMYWLRPDQFVRRPLRWIECFGRRGASITTAPTFAFAYASKRIAPEEIADMDFSGWRFAGMGAERVDVQAVRLFAERFGPRGFRTSTISTGYGLAEATLVVTGCPVDAVPQAALVDWRGLQLGRPLDIERADLETAALSARPAEWILGCGPPLGDVSVRIVDGDGAPLPDGHLGEITVAGPTVAAGYVGGEGRPSGFRDGVLHTADAGFVLDGDLYVLGRIGDMLSVRGRNVYVEDLEARLADVVGIPKGRFAVVAGPDEVLTIVESPPGPWADEVVRVLSRHVGEQYAVAAVSVGRGSIERTSSGKPRRRSMWQSFSTGALGGTVVRREGEAGARPPEGSPA